MSGSPGKPSTEVAAAVRRFLQAFAPFAQMETDALDFFVDRLSLSYFPAGTIILGEGDGVPDALHVIQRGAVEVVPLHADQSGAGEPVVLGPGECFSVTALLEQRAVMSPYRAVHDSFCYRFPAAEFQVLLNRSAVFREFATRFLSRMLRESRQMLRTHYLAAGNDQQAMTRPLRSLLGRAPVSCRPDASIADVLQTLSSRRVGSMIVVDDAEVPVGIFTRHDVLDRVVLQKADLESPIATVMTASPRCLTAEASAYDAALLIAQHGVRHVPVLDGGRLAGIVTERDLFALQRVSVRAVHRTIADAETLEALTGAAADIRRLARSMLGQGMTAEQLTVIISTLNDALAALVIELTAAQFDLHGLQWCWLSFGSEGRYEQTISTDQDNGLIFDGAQTPEAGRECLLPFARAVNRGLADCGFPLCPGEIMAGNPAWCLSSDEWRKRFSSWINDTDPQALLNAVIFFYFRPLHGEQALAQRLSDFLRDTAKDNSRFQRQLAQKALSVRPPLGLITDFVTDKAGHDETIDLKKAGARLFTDVARVMALAAGIGHTNTAQRLRLAGNRLRMPDTEVESAVEAFYFIQTLRLRAQMSHEQGSADANRLAPAALNDIDRRILKACLQQAGKLQRRLVLDYQL